MTDDYAMPADHASQNLRLALSDMVNDSPIVYPIAKTRDPILAAIQRSVTQPKGTYVVSTAAVILLLLLQIAIAAATAVPLPDDPARMATGPTASLAMMALGTIGAVIGTFVLGGGIAIPVAGVIGGIVGGSYAGGRLLRAGIGPYLFLRTEGGIATRSNGRWFLHGEYPRLEFENGSEPRGYTGVLLGYVLGILALGIVSGIAGICILFPVLNDSFNLGTSAIGVGVAQAAITVSGALLLIFLYSLWTIFQRWERAIGFVCALHSDSPGGTLLRSELTVLQESAQGKRPRDWQSTLFTDDLGQALTRVDGEPAFSLIDRCLTAYR